MLLNIVIKEKNHINNNSVTKYRLPYCADINNNSVTK